MGSKAWCVVVLILAGCAGQVDPDMGHRIAADTTCVAQLVLDGVAIYGAANPGPAVATAARVASVLTQVGSVSPQTYDACVQTLKYAGADLNAIKTKIKK